MSEEDYFFEFAKSDSDNRYMEDIVYSTIIHQKKTVVPVPFLADMGSISGLLEK